MGHGSVLTANIPPDRTGRMNASVAKVMAQVGAAINHTFHLRHVGPKITSRKGACTASFAEIRAPAGGEYIDIGVLGRRYPAALCEIGAPINPD